MSLQAPNLDDRTFQQLMEEAHRRARQTCPEWTDRGPSDPGVVLLELFAHLTEVLLYRLNRVPEKAYVEFLRLLGVRLIPPAAATARLTFSVAAPAEKPIAIPRGTRVTIDRAGSGSEAPVFITDADVELAAGQTAVEVSAHHCDEIAAEKAGPANGAPGFSFAAQHPPIVAPTGDGQDLIVGVEATREELEGRVSARKVGDKSFRIWREVESFTVAGADPYVYVVDRMSGRITFAPSVRMLTAGALDTAPQTLAAVPEAGREIRLWYRSGGGASGNVAAGSLTVLKTPVPGVKLLVTNQAPATGGRAAESVANALVRGPLELRSLQRAVTAEDFELLALRASGAVARSKAFTQASLWRHATPGTVEVVLVPAVPAELISGGKVSEALLKERETQDNLALVQHELDQRRPLGTTCIVSWARRKRVTVRAQIVTHPEEDPERVKAAVLEQLHRTINPIPTGPGHPGWQFGRSLYVSMVYDIVNAQPGVDRAEEVALLVDDMPSENVEFLANDAYQARTVYACAGDTLYRTGNGGDGWEAITRFPKERARVVASHDDRPGIVALSTQSEGDVQGSRVYVSHDCGETWSTPVALTFRVNDLAWTLREEAPVLWLATDNGLFEMTLGKGVAPRQVQVVPEDQKVGFGAIAITTLPSVGVQIAVAAHQNRGVFLSPDAGKPGSFRSIGLGGTAVFSLQVQRDGPRAFLWAGFAAVAGEEGKGCMRWELRATEAATRWEPFDSGWKGGTARAFAFGGDMVYAATHRSGVLRLKLTGGDTAWKPCDVTCGLHLQADGKLDLIDCVTCDAQGEVVLAGGPAGIYRSKDSGKTYRPCSAKEQLDSVKLPETWLFCSGDHDLRVRRDAGDAT